MHMSGLLDFPGFRELLMQIMSLFDNCIRFSLAVLLNS